VSKALFHFNVPFFRDRIVSYWYRIMVTQTISI